MTSQHVQADTAALLAVADRFDTGAEMIDQVARLQLGRLAFSGISSGRAHRAGGDALRRALERWSEQLTHWSRATAEIAAVLRIAARDYADAESAAAARIGC